MGAIYAEKPVKLFAGIIAVDDSLMRQAKKLLEDRWGPLDNESDTIPFTFTDYYAPEMGSTLLRPPIWRLSNASPMT